MQRRSSSTTGSRSSAQAAAAAGAEGAQQQQRRSRLIAGSAMACALLALLLVSCAPTPAAGFLLLPSTGRLPGPAAPAAARRLGPAVPVPAVVLRAAADGEATEEAGPKGFGKKAAKKKAAPAAQEAAASAATDDGAALPPAPKEDIAKLNARQKMAYWEIQKEMEREMDLAEIAEYEETQRLLDEGVVGYLPEKISNRMLKRLIPFISMPLGFAALMFGFYLYLAKNTDIEVPPAFVAFSTQVPFLGALAGITYSIMSTSWDPDVEGSFWGVAEFKANVLNLLDSLQKSKREERAKEKMRKYERAPAPNRAKRRELDRLTK